MRTALIIGITHGGESVLVAGPEIGIDDQRKMRSEALSAGGVNDEFAEVQFWTSDAGKERVVKFKTTEDALAREEQRAKDEAAHQASQKAIAEKAKPTEAAAVTAAETESTEDE